MKRRAIRRHVSDNVIIVAPDGNDTRDGRGESRAVATLARARDLARGKRRGRVRIVLRGGTYELAETLVLTPEDSGTQSAPLTICANAGERPVISGGRWIRNWQTVTHHGRRCWVAELPEVAGGEWNFTQLFVAGQRRPRTRLPEEGYFRFDPVLPEGEAPGTVRFAKDDLRNWHNLADVKAVAISYWRDVHLPIAQIDAQRNLVRFHPTDFPSLVDEKGEGARYWVENVFEALDTPGQWYLDRPAGRLYYLPLDGEDAVTTEVVAPRLDCLVKLAGSTDFDGQKVRHVRFENITFAHAEWRLPRNNWGASQAQFFFPGAIIFRGCEDCVMYGCEVAHISQYGVEIQRGSRRNRIIACSIFDTGAGAVKVNSEGLLRPWGRSGESAFVGLDHVAMGWGGKPLPDDFDGAARSVISDNHLYAVGRLYPSCAAIWIGDSGRNRVVHNHIHDAFYTAISVGWTWGYLSTRTLDNRIEFNRIHDIGQGLLSDMGAIYLLGRQPGTIVRNNLLHDVRAHGYGGGGIYPDEGSSGILIENNIVYRALSGGFTAHFGRDNIVRNNIFALAQEAQVGLGRLEAFRAFSFVNNIVYGNGPAVGGSLRNCAFERNLYWRPDGHLMQFAGKTFAEWRSEGPDAGSIIADPLFVAPHAGDFALRADSPALALGFEPIDLSTVGPRYSATRPVRFDQWPAEKDRPLALLETQLQLAIEAPPPMAGAPSSHKVGVPYIDPTLPLPAELTVSNVGDRRLSGTMSLHIEPKGAGKVIGGKRFSYTLRPGQSKALRFQVQITPTAPRMMVHATPRGIAGWPSALAIVNRPQWSVPCIAGSVRLEKVADVLARETPQRGHGAPEGVLQVRMGLSDEHLLVHAIVRDQRMKRGGNPWEGTDVEIFSASPGHNGRAGNAQIFLLPPADGKPAAVFEWIENLVPVDDVQMLCRPIEDGYDLQALIPLARAKLSRGLDRVLLEAVASVTPPGQREFARYSLFGEAVGHDNGAWAMTRVVR